MEIETFIDHTDGTYHIVFWFRDRVKSHHIYNELSEFDQALSSLLRQYPLAKHITSQTSQPAEYA